MAEFPAMPLWTDAYLADTGHLSDAEHGLYLRLLMLMWRSPECRVPNDDAWLARRLYGNATAMPPHMPALIHEFCQISEDGKWIAQKRLQREWNRARQLREKQRRNANVRWNNEKDACHGTATVGNARQAMPTLIPTLIPTNNKESSLRSSPVSQETDAPDEVLTAYLEYRALAKRMGISGPKAWKPDPDRRKALTARLAELGGLDAWRGEVLARIEASPFLRGSTDWKITLDWLLKPKNLRKVVEGNYDERPRGNGDGRSGQILEVWERGPAPPTHDYQGTPIDEGS